LKRVFFILLTIVLLLTGCTKPESNKSIKADNITIFYGFSSYAKFGADQAVINDLLNQFNSLKFEKITCEMDRSSAFTVYFSFNGNAVKHFWVDKNGMFWLNGETQCYKVSSGSFDYQHLKAIYEGSKSIPLGTVFPVSTPTTPNFNKQKI
jgi:AAA+ ATPase superfamily predicted ATPase